MDKSSIRYKTEIDLYRKEMYTYICLIKQISASYDSKTIKDVYIGIEQLYNNFDKSISNNPSELLHTLKIEILNLHIISLNYGYVEISPICVYFDTLLAKLEDTLEINDIDI